MLVTLCIELGLLLYVIVRYRMSALTRLIMATLLLLALFQWAEFNVCEGQAGLHSFYSRLGFVAITLLPAVGIHLVSMIAQRRTRWLIAGSYLFAGIFAGAFALSPGAFENHACTGNYVIFHLSNQLGELYFLYYYSLLFTGLGLCLYYAMDAAPRMREALILQAFGYLSFVLPTAVINTINPASIRAIPSIMCGFAVIYAFVLVFGIAPRVIKQKK